MFADFNYRLQGLPDVEPRLGKIHFQCPQTHSQCPQTHFSGASKHTSLMPTSALPDVEPPLGKSTIGKNAASPMSNHHWENPTYRCRTVHKHTSRDLPPTSLMPTSALLRCPQAHFPRLAADWEKRHFPRLAADWEKRHFPRLAADWENPTSLMPTIVQQSCKIV